MSATRREGQLLHLCDGLLDDQDLLDGVLVGGRDHHHFVPTLPAGRAEATPRLLREPEPHHDEGVEQEQKGDHVAQPVPARAEGRRKDEAKGIGRWTSAQEGYSLVTVAVDLATASLASMMREEKKQKGPLLVDYAQGA